MAAPNTSGNRYRNLTRKLNAPAFRVGVGEVYRKLEREGKIPAEDGIEKKAEYEAIKKAQAERLESQEGLLDRLKRLGKRLSESIE